MKKFLLLLLISLNIYSVGAAQTKGQRAIANLLEQQRLAWNRGDLKAYMDGYLNSDSLVFIGKRGPQYGWQKTYDNYLKSYPNKSAMGELYFSLLKIDIIDSKNAMVLGAWMLKREKDEPSGYFTLRLKKIKGQWKIVYDHSS